ncbi:hypothetical protein [Novosphingobium panipatense]|uniref:hypothetical protein n=1 Tax=Novosphingobium panipatense TaxID=428991 RepID=UPI003605F56A
MPRKLDARRVMIAGMQGWNADEDLILKELGIRHIPPAVLADSSRPILDWIETEESRILRYISTSMSSIRLIFLRCCSTGRACRRGPSME